MPIQKEKVEEKELFEVVSFSQDKEIVKEKLSIEEAFLGYLLKGVNRIVLKNHYPYKMEDYSHLSRED